MSSGDLSENNDITEMNNLSILLLNRQEIKSTPGINAVTYNVHIWHDMVNF